MDVSVDIKLLLPAIVSFVLPLGLSEWFVWQGVKRERLAKRRGFEVKPIAGELPVLEERDRNHG